MLNTAAKSLHQAAGRCEGEGEVAQSCYANAIIKPDNINMVAFQEH
jgi:hypothetical protein